MASQRRQKKGPKFIRYFDPIIKALKQLGGSGRTSEVIQLVAKIKNIPESEQQEVLNSGGLRFDNQVQFARQYLVWDGLIDGSVRGVWSLTDAGWKVDSITDEQALGIFERQHVVHTGRASSKAGEGSNVSVIDDQEEEEAKDPHSSAENAPHREKVLDLLRKMTPTGFEHFCVRLLREHGFEGVSHEGGPGDKGIDGIGTLRINPFVSMSVVFQCKRYQAKTTVTSGEISAFRGSIPNSVDKGISSQAATSQQRHAQ
jgi:restriction system protein